MSPGIVENAYLVAGGKARLAVVRTGFLAEKVVCAVKLWDVGYEVIRQNVEKFLREFKTLLLCSSQITDFQDIPLLRDNLENMKVAEASGDIFDHEAIQILNEVTLTIHVYQFNEEEAVDEFQEEDNVLTPNHWELPSRALEGLWDT
ncbi:hypothetical protein G9A89_005475 [Geosiphon pyriformis]|nr:hypothetical protein G9A89_005475 [Geosiphon pyriformis]